MCGNINSPRIKIHLSLILELLFGSHYLSPLLLVLIPSHKSSVLRDKLDVYGRRVNFTTFSPTGELKLSPIII